MCFLPILKGTLIAIVCLTAIVFIFAIIPEKFREKEGKPTRHGLESIRTPLPKNMVLMLTLDGTTFYPPMPPRCKIFAMITEGGCQIQLKDEEGPRSIPLRNLSVIPTGVDGVPFMDERLILRYSIFAREDRYVRTEYRLYVPNLASPPEDHHLALWPMARGKSSAKPLHSTRERNPVAWGVWFIVKGFDNGKVHLSLYDKDKGKILSEEIFVVDSKRIYETCSIGGIVFLSLDNYTLHC